MIEHIQHSFSERRFWMKADGGEAVLRYLRQGKLLVFESTVVPEEARGQGLGAKLCQAAFEYAKENGYKVTPVCSYVRGNFLKKHPEWRSIVA